MIEIKKLSENEKLLRRVREAELNGLNFCLNALYINSIESALVLIKEEKKDLEQLLKEW